MQHLRHANYVFKTEDSLLLIGLWLIRTGFIFAITMQSLAAAPLWKFPFSQPHFQTVDDKGKITNGVVSDAIVDSTGMLWLTTQRGLVSYDGYQFQKLELSGPASEGPAVDVLTAITRQKNDTLWLASKMQGVYRFDTSTKQSRHYVADNSALGLSSNVVNGIYVDQQDRIWIGLDHAINRISADGNVVESWDLPNGIRGAVFSFRENPEGTMLVGGSFGLLLLDAQQQWRILLRGLNIRDIQQDKQGVYWLSSLEGIWRWDGQNPPQLPSGMPSEAAKVHFKQSLLTSDGLVYATSQSGLFVFDAAQGDFLRHFVKDASIAGSLKTDELTMLVHDEQHQLWVGSWGGGLHKLNLKFIHQFAAIRSSMKESGGLSYNSVRSILELDDGRWLISTTAQGIDVFALPQGRIATIGAPTSNISTYSIIAMEQDSRGRVLAAGNNNRMYELDLVEKKLQEIHIEGLARRQVYRLKKATVGPDAGKLFVGHKDGVCVLDVNLSTCEAVTDSAGGELKNQIISLMQDSFGNFWAGGYQGLIRIRPGLRQGELYSSGVSGLSDGYVYGLAEGPQQALYIVTASGFDRIDKPSESELQFTSLRERYNLQDRLPGGNMIFVGNRLFSGTTVLDLAGDRLEILTSIERPDLGAFWFGSFTKTRDNLMLFGGADGVLMFNPAQMPAIETHSRIRVRRLLSRGEELSLQPIGPTQERPVIKISGKAQAFALQIAATDLTYTHHINYRYRLLDQDTDWQALDAESRWIHYNNLAPGQYQLQVEGTYQLVRGEVQPLLIDVVVAPQWWQTWFFRFVFAMLLLLLFWQIMRWRMQLLKQQAKALELVVEQRTEELQSSMLELKAAQKQLVMQEKMASLGQLVSGVAHEVNTPLGVAYTAVSVIDDSLRELQGQLNTGALRRQNLDQFIEQSTSSLALVVPNLERAARLIQEFKQVAANQESTEPVSLDLAEICQHVAQVLKQQANSQGVALILATPSPLTMVSQRTALIQVLLILMQNALMHAFRQAAGSANLTDTGQQQKKEQVAIQPTPQITLRYHQDASGVVVLECVDNGIGIDEQLLQKIFEPFFTTRRFDGRAGLGLAIAFNLVHQQIGAELTYRPEPGGGSCFMIRWSAPKVV